MVSEPRKQSMAHVNQNISMEVKWRLEHLGALGIVGEAG